MEDIHFIEETPIRGTKVKFIFFNSLQKHLYDSAYIKLIEDSPIYNIDRFIDNYYLIDTYSNEYRLTHSSIIKPTINNPKISLKDTNRYIIGKNKKEQFLINNGFPIDS